MVGRGAEPQSLNAPSWGKQPFEPQAELTGPETETPEMPWSLTPIALRCRSHSAIATSVASGRWKSSQTLHEPGPCWLVLKNYRWFKGHHDVKSWISWRYLEDILHLVCFPFPQKKTWEGNRQKTKQQPNLQLRGKKQEIHRSRNNLRRTFASNALRDAELVAGPTIHFGSCRLTVNSSSQQIQSLEVKWQSQIFSKQCPSKPSSYNYILQHEFAVRIWHVQVPKQGHSGTGCTGSTQPRISPHFHGIWIKFSV